MQNCAAFISEAEMLGLAANRFISLQQEVIGEICGAHQDPFSLQAENWPSGNEIRLPSKKGDYCNNSECREFNCDNFSLFLRTIKVLFIMYFRD